jgi:glutaminase-like protein
MSDQTITVGKIAAFAEGSDTDFFIKDLPVGKEGEEFAVLQIQGGPVYKIDKNDERYSGWSEFLKEWQLMDQRVYVEADPVTKKANLILSSRPRKVVGIREGDGRLIVMLFMSPSAFFLMKNRPGFDKMRYLLEQSLESGTETLVATYPFTGEILDVREIEDDRNKEGGLNGFLVEIAADLSDFAPEARFDRTALDKKISFSRAQNLFNKVASNPDIPFAYTGDCCTARAHKMRQIIESYGIRCEKVWKYADIYPPFGGLKVTTPNSPEGFHIWAYHVAPIVMVEMPDKLSQNLVLDPSLFAGLVTIDTWSQRLVDIDTGALATRNAPARFIFVDKSGETELDDFYKCTNKTLKDHQSKLNGLRRDDLRLLFDSR